MRLHCLLWVVLMGLGLLTPSCAVTFVQITDTQFGMGKLGYQEDVATFQRAVAQINALKPDFVLVGGDLVHNWSPETAQDFLTCAKAFTMPWYVTAGNHDGWATPEFARDFGPDHRVVEQGNVTLLLLNTNLWREADPTAGDAQLAWLTSALQTAADKHQTIIVAGHHPLFTGAVDEKESYENTPLARREKLLALFAQYHVAAYLTGHLHRSLLGLYQGTALVSSASTAVNFTADPLGFRVWHVDAKGFLTHEYVPVTPKPVEQPK